MTPSELALTTVSQSSGETTPAPFDSSDESTPLVTGAVTQSLTQEERRNDRIISNAMVNHFSILYGHARAMELYYSKHFRFPGNVEVVYLFGENAGGPRRRVCKEVFAQECEEKHLKVCNPRADEDLLNKLTTQALQHILSRKEPSVNRPDFRYSSFEHHVLMDALDPDKAILRAEISKGIVNSKHFSFLYISKKFTKN